MEHGKVTVTAVRQISTPEFNTMPTEHLTDNVQRYLYHGRISFNLSMSEQRSKRRIGITYRRYDTRWCRFKTNDAWTCRDAVAQCRCFTRLAAAWWKRWQVHLVTRSLGGGSIAIREGKITRPWPEGWQCSMCSTVICLSASPHLYLYNDYNALPGTALDHCNQSNTCKK